MPRIGDRHAVFAARITEAFDGRGQELFRGPALLFLAVVMLAWHVVWMSGTAARELAARPPAPSSGQVASGTQLGGGAGPGRSSRQSCAQDGRSSSFLAGIAMHRATKAPPRWPYGGPWRLGACVCRLRPKSFAQPGLRRFIPSSAFSSVTGALVTLLAASLAARGDTSAGQCLRRCSRRRPQAALWDSSLAAVGGELARRASCTC